MNPATDCARYDGCSAPICPMSDDSRRDCAWFADEPICQLSDYRGTPLVVRQHKIARATGRDRGRGCFTAAMLEHPCSISRGIRGLDPESPITKARADAWVAGRAKTRKGTPPRSGFQKAVGDLTAAGVAHSAPGVSTHHPEPEPPENDISETGQPMATGGDR